MLDVQEFTNFRNLPPEVRNEIWLHALSYPTDPATEVLSNGGIISIRSVGSTTVSVGQACYEARRLLEQTHLRIVFRQKNDMGSFWIKASSVVVLGPASVALIVLLRLDNASLSKLTNVAVSWTTFGDVFRCIRWLAQGSRSISNIIIDINKPTVEWQLSGPLLDVEKASYYTNLCKSVDAESDAPYLDSPHFRSLLASSFLHPRPRIHFVQTDT